MTSSDLPDARSTGGTRTDTRWALALLGLVLLAGLLVVATGSTRQLLAWAWERHANVLSWYVRPIFVLPLAYFSYRHRVSGIVLTLVALATSMAWFPRPDRVRPEVAEFLAFERAWLTSAWTPGKVLMSTVVVVALGALCLAFWRRSLVYGLVVITSIAGGKLLWGVVEGGGTGWAMLVPALAGLLVCNGVVLGVWRRMRRLRRGRVHRQAPPRTPVPAGRTGDARTGSGTSRARDAAVTLGSSSDDEPKGTRPPLWGEAGPTSPPPPDHDETTTTTPTLTTSSRRAQPS